MMQVGEFWESNTFTPVKIEKVSITPVPLSINIDSWLYLSCRSLVISYIQLIIFYKTNPFHCLYFNQALIMKSS